jgi:hypothetical protein
MIKFIFGEEINSGEVILIPHTEALEEDLVGVKGFPHFINIKNKRTVTGWPTTKENLIKQLDYVKEPYNTLDSHYLQPHERFEIENFEMMENLPPHKRFEMENIASHNVVERMDTIPTDVLYRHRAGGYLPLDKCWVKQADYTA